MNDSQKRINAYKELLPGLKEKVAAMLVLLLVSTTMLITVSFAWVALTTSPEVTGVNTSIAANGNLEIALVGEEGNIPDESKVGDSALDLIARNITWGNLINLGDPVYGLDHMVLRPARLNEDDLLGSPLFAAIYDEDGRVKELSSEFAFAKWEEGEGFIIPSVTNQTYGVRAIASTRMETSDKSLEQFRNMLSAVNGKNATAGNTYLALTNNKTWMSSLADVMGVYMTARMSDEGQEEKYTNPTVSSDDISNLRDMYAAFIDAFAAEEQALVDLANLQLFAINGGDTSKYTEYTAASLRENKSKLNATKETDGDTNNDGVRDSVKLLDLNSFYTDYDAMVLNQKRLQQLSGLGDFKWKTKFTDENGTEFDLNTVVAAMVNVGTCTVENGSTAATPINSIGATAAMNYLGKSDNLAVITNGVIQRFEQRIGAYMSVDKITITVSAKRSIIAMDNKTVDAAIKTSAKSPSTFSKDLKATESMYKGDYILKAKDIYGLAVDFWVRTNAQGSYLTLEGNVLTKTEMVRDTKNINGVTYELYAYSYSYEDEESKETVILDYTLYKEDGKWYNADSVAEFSPPDPNKFKDEDVKEKYSEVETVIGYEGTNRVWGSDSTLSVNSTTQGSGSCYVYYAETPEDQMRSLKLLESMKVAFVDGNGQLLTGAHMDTERFYAENGKVIVPIVLDSDSKINLGVDETGETRYAITALEQNVPTRITAILYLDGTKLSNNEVLSSSEIQGQINIQFGSSKQLVAFENEELKLQSLDLSASVDKTEFNYDEASESNPMKVNVTLKVDGTTPKTVKAFFLRSITSTQGTREGTITFTKESENTWKASYTFDAPGTYLLRTVELDGISYDLPADKCPVVTINGFTVRDITWDQSSSNAVFMTASTIVSSKLELEFATNDVAKMPKKVTGCFMREEDGSVNNVEFTYDTNLNKWKGTVNFRVSGNYTLSFLILDGEYEPVLPVMQKTAEVYLGMKVHVSSGSPTNFVYEDTEENPLEDNERNLYMTVKIMDDTGKELFGLKDAKLFYKSRSSSLDSRGLETDLTWVPMGDSGYYTGTFKSQVGMYDFSRVQVGDDIITNATSSPSFIIQSPIPPTFNAGNTPEYQYSASGATDAYVSVILNDADALGDITAIVEKIDTATPTEYRISSVDENGVPTNLVSSSNQDDGTTLWSFYLPLVNNMQQGKWRIKAIEIADFGDSLITFDLSGETSKISTKVVTEINTGDVNSGNFATEFNGVFLEEHTVPAGTLSMVVNDFEGAGIKDISDITLTYSYKGGSKDKGGYEFDTTNVTPISVTMHTDDGITFKQTNAFKLKYAGTYSLTNVSYTFFGGNKVQLKDDNLTGGVDFVVKSDVPYVKFTATNPTAGTKFDGGSGGDKVQRTNTLSTDGYTVVCYFKANISGWSCAGYNPSKATVKLYDAGSNFVNATCTIISTGSASDVVYTFTPGNEENTQELGSSSGSNKSGIGSKAQATELIMTDKNGTVFTFKLKNPLTATANE